MTKKHLITAVEPGSVADEMEIEAGDSLISINGETVSDVFDYRYLTSAGSFEILIEKPDGEEWLLEIEMDAGEELGLVFDSGLMDEAKNCRNKCVFCFIDQLPPGMRSSLYFKDDDSRLSFLTGNYVTLTNMSEAELDKILFYHLSPINISVHTINPELRIKMLGNKNAGNLLPALEKIKNAGVEMNFQIVLCKGINDGAELDSTISGLSRFMPAAKSLSVVPVGLSAHRDKLFPLEKFTKEDAAFVLEQIRGWQKRLNQESGSAFVFAADEFYIKAGIPIPDFEEYDDFPQIENGVGMLAQFRREFEDGLEELKIKASNNELSVCTGAAAYPFMRELADALAKHVDGLTLRVYDIRNDFFGHDITVSGLLTGRDIISQLKGKPLGSAALIPANALRSGEETLLDDTTVSDISRELGVPVIPVECNGYDFIHKCTRLSGY